jgi:photosystem II stability/assembly factor-like uncharacterized protein
MKARFVKIMLRIPVLAVLLGANLGAVGPGSPTSAATQPVTTVKPSDNDCTSEEVSIIGREGVVSCQGNLGYPTWYMVTRPESSIGNDDWAYPGPTPNSRKFEPHPEAGVWQCYKDGGPTCYTALTSVSMVSANEGWAVGYGGIIFHYQGGEWQKVAGPTTGRSLYSLSMLDASDGWAVGYDFNAQKDLFLHWDGNAWNELDAASSYFPSSVAMISATDGWAVGGPYYDPVRQKQVSATLHWDGSTWQAIDNPGEGALFSVDMLSSTDGWVVGHSGSLGNDSIILHWDGVEWISVSSPTTNSLASVSMTSGSDGWAVGDYGAILHWNGASRQLASSPTANHLTAVAMVAANDGWAMGIGERSCIEWQRLAASASPTKRALSISMLSRWTAGR